MELAIRIHNAKGESDISVAAKRRLRAIFKIVFIALLAGLIAFIISVTMLSHKPDHYGFPFLENICQVIDTIAYLFLC